MLCYAWQRYRQLTDNLVDALGYHMKQLEDESKAQANKHFVAEQLRRQQETPQVGRLLQPIEAQLNALATELGAQWLAFNLDFILPSQPPSNWRLLCQPCPQSSALRDAMFPNRSISPCWNTSAPSRGRTSCSWFNLRHSKTFLRGQQASAVHPL